MPWKNGGGETREVLVSPPGASLDALEWRVSLASVASDGPFSEFPGITRTLSVLSGAGITLRVGDGPSRRLLQSSEPCTFNGETPTSSWLVDGPIVDLNVMTRRGIAIHRVTRMSPEGISQLVASADTTLLFCRTGELLCRAGETSVELSAEDCALIEGEVEPVQLAAAQAPDLFVIELYRELTSSGS
jgi:environmental stress-induced protein Ves